MNLWRELTEDEDSKRTHILHNIDDIWGSAALTVSNWKVVKGTNYNGQWDGWYGPAGDRDPINYNLNLLKSCPTARILLRMKYFPTDGQIRSLREETNVECEKKLPYSPSDCNPLKSPCLFNVNEDPCELTNLASKYPNILNSVLAELDKYNRSVIPPSNMPLDPRADPRFWDNVWTNFGDYSFFSRDMRPSEVEVISIMPHNPHNHHNSSQT